jgi:hypothetical protein
MTITKLDYTFAFLTRDNWFFGVDAGLYVMKLGLSLNAPTRGTFSTQSLTAPLPVVGFRGEYGINDRWTLRGSFQWFGVDLTDVSGHFTWRRSPLRQALFGRARLRHGRAEYRREQDRTPEG